MLKPTITEAPALKRKRRWPHRLVVVLFMAAGALVTVWPVIDTFRNNQDGAIEVTQYVHEMELVPPPVKSAEILAAQNYNAALSPRALFDPWAEDGDAQPGAGHADYRQQLKAVKAMARIRIPKINVDLPVFHDASNASMAIGAGHMFGTSLPVGGADTHSVIAAHTNMRGRTMFDRTPELKPGDEFFIDVAGETLTYRVQELNVVEPWELEAVSRVEGADLLTLVTCYTPPGEHKQRLLVRGVRADALVTPEIKVTTTANTTTVPVAADMSIQEWMWPRLGVAAAAFGILLLMSLGWLIGDLRARKVGGR